MIKGKGGLSECPKCKSEDIETYDSDYPDHQTGIMKVHCNKCSAKYTELWKAVDWEEVE